MITITLHSVNSCRKTCQKLQNISEKITKFPNKLPHFPLDLNFRSTIPAYIAKKGDSTATTGDAIAKGQVTATTGDMIIKYDTTVTGGEAIAVAKGQATAIATDGSTVIAAGNKITTTTADGTTTTEKLNKE